VYAIEALNCVVVSSSNYSAVAGKVLQTTGLRQTWLLKRRWLYHVIFWTLEFLFLALLFYSMYGIPDLSFYACMLLFFPCELVLIYFNLYVLIPRLLFGGKYFQYALSLATCIVLVAIINTFIHRLCVYLGSPWYATGVNLSFSSLFARSFELFSLTSLTTGIKLAKDWLIQLQWIREKEKQYLETELNFLKTQINPHFFFNTLNNLYSLTLKKSDLAPEVVLKLSDLMSYMLYESNTPKTPLDKEISYLRNYIDVERLRFGQRLEVSFAVSGPTEQVHIPPMILILFVENSFKHGTRNVIHNIAISITLQVTAAYLFFEVKNPVGQNPLGSEQVGIGLKNAIRRLDLLYAQQYTLDTHIENNTYIASLKIPVW
jgi:two-component system, LytTR family, sensor kinase